MKAGQLEKGMCILYKNNEPFLVQEREFVKPGKGGAFVRCKLKALLSGHIIREVIRSHDTLELAEIENIKGQYLYEDGTHFYFMDQTSFEEHTVKIENFENHKNYLYTGEIYSLVFFNSNIIDVLLPPKVALTVTSAAEAVKGDTATGVTKMVECDTGAIIKVPGFIQEGEKILVNTETGEYAERAN